MGTVPGAHGAELSGKQLKKQTTTTTATATTTCVCVCGRSTGQPQLAGIPAKNQRIWKKQIFTACMPDGNKWFRITEIPLEYSATMLATSCTCDSKKSSNKVPTRLTTKISRTFPELSRNPEAFFHDSVVRQRCLNIKTKQQLLQGPGRNPGRQRFFRTYR